MKRKNYLMVIRFFLFFCFLYSIYVGFLIYQVRSFYEKLDTYYQTMGQQKALDMFYSQLDLLKKNIKGFKIKNYIQETQKTDPEKYFFDFYNLCKALSAVSWEKEHKKPCCFEILKKIMKKNGTSEIWKMKLLFNELNLLRKKEIGSFLGLWRAKADFIILKKQIQGQKIEF